LNLVQRGYHRARNILFQIEDYKIMSIAQVIQLYFPFATGRRKAQEVLLKLHRKGKLERWRGEEGYCYSLEPKTGRADHTVLVNWCRIWFEKRLKSWEGIHRFVYEDDYGFLRSDAFVAIKNKTTGKLKFWFVEADLSKNKFDKVSKYNKLLEQINQGKLERWWIKLTDGFPWILVVTTTQARKEKILSHIAEENKHGLEFRVYTLDELKGEL